MVAGDLESKARVGQSQFADEVPAGAVFFMQTQRATAAWGQGAKDTTRAPLPPEVLP